MAHSTDIVGYSFNADQYCPQCIGKMFGGEAEQTEGGFWGMSDQRAKEVLDHAAEDMDIDWEDESSFDSGDFPKVIFRDQTHDLYVSGCGQDEHGCNSRCGQCGTVLGGYDTCPTLEDEYRFQVLADGQDITGDPSFGAWKDATEIRIWEGEHGDMCLAEFHLSPADSDWHIVSSDLSMPLEDVEAKYYRLLPWQYIKRSYE